VNSLPKTVTRQRRNCDLNPGPSAPESSMLTTRLPSHRYQVVMRSHNSAGQVVGFSSSMADKYSSSSVHLNVLLKPQNGVIHKLITDVQ